MIKVYLPKSFKNFLFLNISLSWLTGLCFFSLSTWFTIEGEFGPEKHPLQYPILQLHAASAFLIMIFFGALLATHINNAWGLNRSRNTGTGLVSIVGFQITTAYCLYYLSDEILRLIFMYAHLFVGVFFPIVLISHIIIGKRSRKKSLSL